jgi:hypothetical protein
VFFFGKKNQKTFTHCARRRRLRDSQPKVFCFFSSEKKILSFSAARTWFSYAPNDLAE